MLFSLTKILVRQALRFRFALLMTVDDATGTVPAAMFCQEEDTFSGDIGCCPAGPTQFARAMEELGIRRIFARSPKDRVERAAATFRNRLVTELRLPGPPPSLRPMSS